MDKMIVVKGTEEDALNEAERRGIRVRVERVMKAEVVLHTDADLSDLNDWFLDNPAAIEGYGYPAGTLLWWRHL